MYEHIKKLRECIKIGELFTFNGETYDVSDLQQRMCLLEALVDALPYLQHEVEKLADLALYEAIANKHPDKTTIEEYPILSNMQLARRFSGVHRKKDFKGLREVSMMYAENIGTDGVDYSYPHRKKRSDSEYDEIEKQRENRLRDSLKEYSAFKYGESAGVVTVNIQTGKVTRHSDRDYNAIYPKNNS